MQGWGGEVINAMVTQNEIPGASALNLKLAIIEVG